MIKPFLCEVKTITAVRTGDNSQKEFRRRLENQVRNKLNKISQLAYHVHIHSYKLSIPPDTVLHPFLERIVREVKQIHERGDALLLPRTIALDSHTTVDITRSSGDKLKVQVSLYGDLNTNAINNAVDKAVNEQLKTSGEAHPDLARIVVVCFASDVYFKDNSDIVVFDGLEFDDEILLGCINDLLRQHKTLSAIAVMTNSMPSTFAVVHNPNPLRVESLNRSVFDDRISKQIGALVGDVL
jgi:hypothetical protein